MKKRICLAGLSLLLAGCSAAASTSQTAEFSQSSASFSEQMEGNPLLDLFQKLLETEYLSYDEMIRLIGGLAYDEKEHESAAAGIWYDYQIAEEETDTERTFRKTNGPYLYVIIAEYGEDSYKPVEMSLNSEARKISWTLEEGFTIVNKADYSYEPIEVSSLEEAVNWQAN